MSAVTIENKISASQFFNAWKEISALQAGTLLCNWSNASAYTDCIFDNVDSVLMQLAKKLELEYYCNYYSIDAVFFKEQDYVPGIAEQSTSLRKLRIAFEHENYFSSGLFQEVSHLLITNCELRVLVTYPDNNYDWEMNRLHDLILGAEGSVQISAEGSFLMINGFKSPENVIHWEGSMFNSKAWISLT